jgi:lysyl-tRNA synthetase, class II
MSIANTTAKTIFEERIIEPNDQTEVRVGHLKELEKLIGNSYPNKFERSKITGTEDTISNIHNFAPVAELAKQLKDATPTGEKPDQELKAQLNEKLKDFGNVRISGRLAVPPRVMGKAAFVHLSDGINRLQIYVRRDDAKAVFNGALSEPSAVADGLSSQSEVSANNLQPSATADGSDVNGWEVFKLLDHGDFIGVSGFLFLTNTGELSVHVETLQFLSKALMPMPDKMHEIGDAEISRRYRYIDLIASSLRNKTDDEIEEEKRTGQKKLTTREVFERRAKLISGMRRFLDDAGYIEVETPMLTPKATGAAATPFETHHNALDIPLYARIAPELYLKRLTVGGFEKVYELNRNFRNEGLSHKHNPEFTMLEFYCAYMDVNGMMDFCEEMLKESVQKATGGSLVVNYDNKKIDFSKFERLTMKEAIHRAFSFNDSEDIRKAIAEGSIPAEMYLTMSDLLGEKYNISWLDDAEKLRALANLSAKRKSMLGEPTGKVEYKLMSRTIEEGNADRERIKNLTRKLWQESVSEMRETFDGSKNQTEQAARDLVYLFEDAVEEKLIQPTFIIDYPKSISPLSKASPENPQIAERFELFINGMECANGFSELNDPQEQYERFVDQGKEREGGDAEAMVLDEDYIRALAYGMPPAAGIGIGIDRLVMLLTNKHSIRDVILFPHMRPEKREEEKES